MNKTNIEWCDYTWNPVTGCTHGCKWCYAHALHNMRHKAYKEGKKVPECYSTPFNEPRFHPDRLTPGKISLPKHRNRIAQQISPDKPVVFVCSMGDLFCADVGASWIADVLRFCNEHQEAVFMLLTKKPLRYSNFFIPNNCIIGTSIASNNDYERYDDLLCADVYDHNRRFVSIEPLMGDCSLLVFRELEFVIVGAMTGKNPVIPRKEWLDSIRHERIYLKDNILKYGL